jgi:hypothetical protein
VASWPRGLVACQALGPAGVLLNRGEATFVGNRSNVEQHGAGEIEK